MFFHRLFLSTHDFHVFTGPKTNNVVVSKFNGSHFQTNKIQIRLQKISLSGDVDIQLGITTRTVRQNSCF